MINKELLEKHISVNPDIQHGKPCVKGTRVPIYVILEALALGMDTETIKKEFGPITDDLISRVSEKDLVGSLTVVRKDRYRIRKI